MPHRLKTCNGLVNHMDTRDRDELIQHILMSETEAQVKLHNGMDPKEIRQALGPFTSETAGGIESVKSAIDAYLRLAVRTDLPEFLRAFWGGSQPASVIGSLLADVRNTTMHSFAVSPAATIIEREMIRGIAERIGIKANGIFTTGGSNSNELGLICARENLIPGSHRTGIQGHRLCVLTSDEAHYSVDSAMNRMGIGMDSIIRVPTNEGIMEPAELVEAIQRVKREGMEPLAIVSTAGSTVRGAFEDLNAISNIAEEYGIWHHVDAAWGGSVLFSNQHRSMLNGIERADSVTFDAHKMLGASMVCSMFLLRNGHVLESAMAHTKKGDYLFDDPASSQSLGRISPQCGRRADALKLWLIWLDIGSEGFGQRVDYCMDIADHMANLVRKTSEVELISHRFTNVCIRFTPKENETPEEGDERVRRARNRLEHEGKAMVIDSQLDGRLVIRFVASQTSVTKDSVERFLADLINADKM